MKILIVGGSGLVGRQLTDMLLQKGHEVNWLSRRGGFEKDKIRVFRYDYTTLDIDLKAFEGVDVIVNLAGANIGAKRWTARVRKEIIDSRVKTTEVLYQGLQKAGVTVRAFITASAIGYYGTVSTERIFREDDKVGDDFLAKVCQKWEVSAKIFETESVRVVKLRTGVVLSENGGVFDDIKKSFMFGVKAVLGSGNQSFPWVHIDDLCRAYIFAIENKEITGAYNVVAPEHLSYEALVDELGKHYKRIFFKLRIPEFILRILFGKMSVILLEGSRISSEKLQSAGFNFQYRTISEGFKSLLNRS